MVGQRARHATDTNPRLSSGASQHLLKNRPAQISSVGFGPAQGLGGRDPGGRGNFAAGGHQREHQDLSGINSLSVPERVNERLQLRIAIPQ